MTVPTSHPRYVSLKTRELLEQGVQTGITAAGGLIAHGRGEAFDYLIGEKTQRFALRAIKRAAQLLIAAKHPVISVNGNTAVLVPNGLIALAELISAPLEVNIFHPAGAREQKIALHLQQHGAKKILLPLKTCTIAHLDSNRRFVHPEGIKKADVVFVPLEDGDRTEALIKNGKSVITVDLNPLSRTAKTATVTIVDNIVRALPKLIGQIESIQRAKIKVRSIARFDNQQFLREALLFIAQRFNK